MYGCFLLVSSIEPYWLFLLSSNNRCIVEFFFTRVLEQHPAEGRRRLKELSLLSRGALAQTRALRWRLPCACDPDTVSPGHIKLANVQGRAKHVGVGLEMIGQQADGLGVSITGYTTGAKVSDEGYTAHSRHDCR